MSLFAALDVAVVTSLALILPALSGTNTLVVTQVRVPESLSTNLQVRFVMDTTNSNGAKSIRIAKDPRDNQLYYLKRNGDIYRVDLVADGGGFTNSKLYSADDHGIASDAQGMAIGPEGTIYLVGNIATNAGNSTLARIMKGVPDVNSQRAWFMLAQTEPYPLAGTGFDHFYNGVVVSADGNSIYVSCGSRTDHGEVQSKSGLYPETREVALTAKILCLPTSASNLFLFNDTNFLLSAGYLFAEGTRNAFDLAFAPGGDLFGTDNGPDRDMSDELNWLRRGLHYGFPWRMGGADNPQQFADYNPTNDLLLNPAYGAVREGYYHNDPAFPPVPGTFAEPVINLGPDADSYRDPADGHVKRASVLGQTLSTVTAHRSPLGLVFDTTGAMAAPFQHRGFLLSWMPNTLSEPSEDMLQIELTKIGETNYQAYMTRIVTGFSNPIDAEIVSNRVYVLEYGGNQSIWEITFPAAQPGNGAPLLPAQPERTIAELTLLTVTNTATDTDIPANVLTYQLLDPPSGAMIDENGVITWTPAEDQGPTTNTITTVVSDGALSTTNNLVVIVIEVNSAPVLPAQTNRTITELTSLTVTNTATDADIPANVLTYHIIYPPDSAVIDANGVITWTPSEAQGPTTNTLTTVVSDGSLNATNSFAVTVTTNDNGPRVNVWAWGENSSGQCNVPPDLTNAVSVAAGSLSPPFNGFSLAVRADGTLAVWGALNPSDLPHGLTNLVAVSAGRYGATALRADGTVVVVAGDIPEPPSSATNIIAIASGNSYCLALRVDGTVLAWGFNCCGQTDVPPQATNLIAVSSCNLESLALMGNGTVLRWGDRPLNDFEVLANNGVAIAAGIGFNSVLLNTGFVAVSGSSVSYANLSPPSDLTNAVAIGAGGFHILAVRSDGAVVGWGGNSFGQTTIPIGLPFAYALSAAGDSETVTDPDGGTREVFHGHSLALVDPTRSGAPPRIVRHPNSQTAASGTVVFLSAGAIGFPPLTYQWFFNGTNALAGATNSTLRLNNIHPSQSGLYTVLVSNAAGSATSQASMLNILPALDVHMVPAISLFGEVGASYRLDYINAVGPTNDWYPITTLTLTKNPHLYFDVSAIGQPRRFYRSVQVP